MTATEMNMGYTLQLTNMFQEHTLLVCTMWPSLNQTEMLSPLGKTLVVSYLQRGNMYSLGMVYTVETQLTNMFQEHTLFAPAEVPLHLS